MQLVRVNTKPFGGIGKRSEEGMGEDAGDKLALEIICSVEQDVEDKAKKELLVWNSWKEWQAELLARFYQS